jgi:hypothetical protein
MAERVSQGLHYMEVYLLICKQLQLIYCQDNLVLFETCRTQTV